MTGAGQALPYAGGRSKVRAWVRMARPHFVPFSVSAGLVGIAAGAEDPTFLSVLLGLLMCAFGYPFGVVLNDLADREADAVNAPDRPLVTGEISPRSAIAALAVCAGGFTLAAAIVAPGLAIWSAIAIGGHVVYQLTKGIPMVGNVANGIDMALFAVIGAAAAAPERSWLDMPAEIWALTALIALVVSGFCLVGYFKDVPGDRKAGYRTLPVAIGPDRARWFAPPWFVAAVAGAVVLAVADPGALAAEGTTVAFWVLLAAATAAFALSMRHLLADPHRRYYEALVWTTRGMVLFTLALGGLVDQALIAAAAVPLVVFLELALRQTQGTGQA